MSDVKWRSDFYDGFIIANTRVAAPLQYDLMTWNSITLGKGYPEFILFSSKYLLNSICHIQETWKIKRSMDPVGSFLFHLLFASNRKQAKAQQQLITTACNLYL